MKAKRGRVHGWASLITARGVAGTQRPVGLGDAFAARASFACLRPLEVRIPWVARQSSRPDGSPDGPRANQVVARTRFP